MKKIFATILLAGIFVVGMNAVEATRNAEIETAIAEATASLDDYMLQFTARDTKGWASTLNYPHVRIAGGQVRVWETEQEYADYMDFDAFAKRFGWDHSHWLAREVITASTDKVHFATTFQRFNDNNEPIATFESLYIVTKVNDHWGTQVRSSFAP